MTSGAGARALDLLDKLVAIPSVTGAEGPLLDFLEERFRTRGFTVRTRKSRQTAATSSSIAGLPTWFS
jgi:acetylornithine deacetylase/succinyl-diaminopimelate desuccinylase-like protein